MRFGKIFKRTVQVLAGLGLCVLFGFPITNAWLEAHPENADVLLGAASQVDQEAGTMTQAGQFVSNLEKSRQNVAEDSRAKAEDKANEEAERRADELRRFNADESNSYSD